MLFLLDTHFILQLLIDCGSIVAIISVDLSCSNTFCPLSEICPTVTVTTFVCPSGVATVTFVTPAFLPVTIPVFFPTSAIVVSSDVNVNSELFQLVFISSVLSFATNKVSPVSIFSSLLIVTSHFAVIHVSPYVPIITTLPICFPGVSMADSLPADFIVASFASELFLSIDHVIVSLFNRNAVGNTDSKLILAV